MLRWRSKYIVLEILKFDIGEYHGCSLCRMPLMYTGNIWTMDQSNDFDIFISMISDSKPQTDERVCFAVFTCPCSSVRIKQLSLRVQKSSVSVVVAVHQIFKILLGRWKKMPSGAVQSSKFSITRKTCQAKLARLYGNGVFVTSSITIARSAIPRKTPAVCTSLGASIYDVALAVDWCLVVVTWWQSASLNNHHRPSAGLSQALS